MNWLTRLIANRPDPSTLDPALRETLAQWQMLPHPDLGKAHFETRYVIINTEATGLNLDTDRVLAVGAIAVENGLLSPKNSFYASLDPDPATALTKLLAFVGSGPVVVFNATFNRTMLERNLDAHLGVEPEWTWLDLHWLLPSLYADRIDGPARLADWMKVFGIETFQRHHALGDAYAIAQLMLTAETRALAQGLTTPRSLAEIERDRRQLRRNP